MIFPGPDEQLGRSSWDLCAEGSWESEGDWHEGGGILMCNYWVKDGIVKMWFFTIHQYFDKQTSSCERCWEPCSLLISDLTKYVCVQQSFTVSHPCGKHVIFYIHILYIILIVHYVTPPTLVWSSPGLFDGQESCNRIATWAVDVLWGHTVQKLLTTDCPRIFQRATCFWTWNPKRYFWSLWTDLPYNS